MKKNVGNTDKIIRLILAAILATLYFSGTVTGTLGIVMVVVAAMLVITSFVSFCGLYNILGVSTCKVKR